MLLRLLLEAGVSGVGMGAAEPGAVRATATSTGGSCEVAMVPADLRRRNI